MAEAGEQELSSEQDDLYFRLRPVTSQDFAMAIKKLKASVDDSGKEIMKVRSAMLMLMLTYMLLCMFMISLFACLRPSIKSSISHTLP